MKKNNLAQKNRNIVVCEPEIHHFIDSLCKERFYGEITFYFQNGAIEFCKKINRFSKNDILKNYQSLDVTSKVDS